MSHVKEAYYFSHDSNARNDPKISALINDFGMEGYGIFWAIVEILSEQENYKLKKFNKLYSGLSRQLLLEENKLRSIIEAMLHDYELLLQDENFIWSASLLRRMNIREAKRQAKVEAGRLGGIKSGKVRAMRSNAEAKAKQNEAPLEANEPKESKVKERKGKESKGNKSTVQNSTVCSAEVETHDTDNGEASETPGINEYPADFEAFWQAYPKARRKEKRAAYKAWKTRLKQGKAQGITPEALITAARHYAAEMEAKGKEPEYIKLPKTFLGPNKPFEEYIDPPPAQGLDPPKAWSKLRKYINPEEVFSHESG